MRVIALTGGIASGKSTVAALLRERGAVVVDADIAARAVVEPGTPGFDAVVKRFGASIIDDVSGRIDRQALGAVVFSDKAARHDLEQITHPLIRAQMAGEIAAAINADAPLVVVDIPLLYESGRDAEFPEVLVVWVDEATQRQRLAARDGLDPDAITQRLAAQLPIDEKRRRATWVIDNSRDQRGLAAQVAALWETLVLDGPGIAAT